MIRRLQRKFITICTVSVLAVVILVFALISVFSVRLMNRNLDILADGVSEGGGKFPDRFHDEIPPKKGSPNNQDFDFITPETPFSTRHFTVWLDSTSEVIRVNTEFIHSVGEDEARALVARIADNGRERGWVSTYRYKHYQTDDGGAIVFIDGSMSRASTLQSLTISALVLLGCAALVIFLVVLLARRAIKPIADSYEKQRQFVTDANHELKTPLTLILANLDLAEAELGKNEWLDDIRAEGHRMSELVNQLVALSRMDEESDICFAELSMSDIVADTVSDFVALVQKRGKSITTECDSEIFCMGDEALIRRLVSVLLDNAVKYCDEGGEINVSLSSSHRQILFMVENSCSTVDELDLDRLFDRFYRADKSRNFMGGYGIGLSIAHAIVMKHGGEIYARKTDDSHIALVVALKSKA